MMPLIPTPVDGVIHSAVGPLFYIVRPNAQVMPVEDNLERSDEKCPTCSGVLDLGPKGRYYCRRCGSAKMPRSERSNDEEDDQSIDFSQLREDNSE
jgi:ribosomal protein S27AE